TSLDEAIPLREEGLKGRILLMTGFWRGEEEEIVRLGLTPTVWEPWQIESLEKAAARIGVGKHPVHLKVDTGMGRLGTGLETLQSIGEQLANAKHLEVEGVSTHLASSEVLDAPSSAEQLKRFEEARRMVRGAGLSPSLVH